MSQEFLKELISPGEKSNSFEESLLWKYSELASLSYEDGDIPGYADLVVVDEHDRIIGKKDGQEVWVGFRGSGADSAHWLGNTGNLHALPNKDSVCRGFANAVQKFHDSLKSWCQGSRIIHLTGHSRGGAFATLEGSLLANDFEDAEVNVVVFGCPKVGTSTFAEKFRNQKNLRWAGFQHAADHVGKLPPWGQHVHLPADPLTDFQRDASSLLQTIPTVGKTFQVELRGRGFRDQPGLFKDDTELKEMLEAKEVNTAEEVQETIKKMNKRLRKLLDSRIFAQRFSDEEKRVLSQDLCSDWSVDVKIPTCGHGALPIILIDLPGSTEDGLIGEFIKTMVKGACSRASTCLLLLTPDMVIEYDRKGTDLVRRFFGGASDFRKYYIVITKVFGKKTVDQWNRRVYQTAAQLKPEPLGIRFIDSYLLRAHVASRAGPLPERFPSVEVDTSDEKRRRCEAEKQRCQIIFEGIKNKHMKEEDLKKFNGTDMEKDLKDKLDQFPETAGFTSELCSFVVLGPYLKRMQRGIEGVVHEIHQLVEVCLRREAEVDACLKLLCNLDVQFMEPLKEKAWLKVQGQLEWMAASDSPGHGHEVAGEFYEAYVEILRQQLAEHFGWTGESAIPDFVSESLSRRSDISWVSKQFAAVVTTLSVAGAGALSVAKCGSFSLASYAGRCNSAIAETPDQRLASLKECADLSLSKLNDSVKSWLQTKLEGQLSMLKENSDLPHLQHLEKKLQQYLKVCDDLQEIQKVVKDLYQPPNAIA